jgi:hypothetical protein
MKQKRIIGIICIIVIVMFTGTKWASSADFHGDGTYTINGDSYILLNNGISITLSKIDKLEKGAGLNGSSVGVYKYPSEEYGYSGGPEIGVTLVINNSRYIFLSPTNPEQQIIERGNNNNYVHPGVVMKLVSLDKDKGEAIISFRSITGNINFNNSFIVIPSLVIILAILAFVIEFIIVRRRSTNTSFLRSIIYTIPILLFALFSDPEWGVLSAILIFPFALIESLLVSFIANKIAIKKNVLAGITIEK